jgi:hypothetical protein
MGNQGDMGEGNQGRQERSFWTVNELEVEGVATRWRGQGPKDFFGQILEFGGRRVTGREQIIEGGDVCWEDVIDVGKSTRGCGGPWDTYSSRGGTSIGVVIRIGGVERINRIGHLTLQSARIRLS